MSKVAVLPIELIEENPHALRVTVDRENPAYEELKNGIKNVGLLNAISVREYEKPDGTIGYRLVDGLHRKTACQDLGFETIPVSIVTVADSELLSAQIIGNQNVKTTKTQFAQALKQLIQHQGLSLEEVAVKVSKKKAWVSEQLGLLDLPLAVQKLIDEDRLSVANALSLRRVKDRIDEFLAPAMTESPDTFAGRVDEAVKESRAAALQGRKVGAPVFKAKPRLRKTSELNKAIAEIEAHGHCADLMSLVQTQGLSKPSEVIKGILDWLFHLDPVSVAAEKAKWDKEQADKAEEKKRKEAERLKKKEEEAAKAVAEVQAAAV